jgi:hypothetical protein
VAKWKHCKGCRETVHFSRWRECCERCDQCCRCEVPQYPYVEDVLAEEAFDYGKPFPEELN